MIKTEHLFFSFFFVNKKLGKKAKPIKNKRRAIVLLKGFKLKDIVCLLKISGVKESVTI